MKSNDFRGSFRQVGVWRGILLDIKRGVSRLDQFSEYFNSSVVDKQTVSCFTIIFCPST
ncbi:MAG: hypothetical protein LBI95_04355 [Holosporales bacterium]|nr:hypothetical protein [Holosporales bacterium]